MNERKIISPEFEETVDRFLRGDSEQYRVIKARIVQYIRHQQLFDRSEQDELVDEIVQILYQNLSNNRFRGDNIRSFNVYIYSIVRNRIRRHISKRRRIVYGYNELDLPSAENLPNPEISDLVRKVFSSLDEKCGRLLRLKFIEGWSDQEIADGMDKTKNAISTAISRCVKKTREIPFISELL